MMEQIQLTLRVFTAGFLQDRCDLIIEGFPLPHRVRENVGQRVWAVLAREMSGYSDSARNPLDYYRRWKALE